MVKTQWKILFVTFVVSCTSFALLITSLGTSQWLNGQATSLNSALEGHITVNYGLFTGSISRQVITTPTTFELQMTCLFSENVCVQSCQPTQEAREREVLLLLYGKAVATNCNGLDASNVDYPEEGIEERRKLFIKAGIYIATLLFLCMALLFSFLSAIFAAVSVVMNPVFMLFSVPGLYIWNTATAISSLLTLILWGVQQGSLSDNMAVQDTLRLAYPFDSHGQSSLGFSFYLIIAAIVLHGVMNNGMLYWRQRIINREPPPVMIQIDKPEAILQY